MSTVNRVLDRLRFRATTANQFNQGIISLDDIMTPEEAREIDAGMAQRGDDETNIWSTREADWRQQFTEWSTCKGFSHAHGFVRVWNRPSATLYRTTGFSGRAPTRLVVLFTGGVNRMMVPSWVFLAHLPRFPVYVLAVRSGWTFYREGLPGLTKDFSATVEWLRNCARENGLSIHAVMGSSGASLPALRAGHALGARRRVLFGLPHISDDDLAQYPLVDGDGTASNLEVDGGLGVTLIVGSEESRDIKTLAEARRRMPRAKAVVVAGAGHNVVAPLARDGKLYRLLRRGLGPWRLPRF